VVKSDYVKNDVQEKDCGKGIDCVVLNLLCESTCSAICTYQVAAACHGHALSIEANHQGVASIAST
jgi:hypothetical protein